MSEPKEFKATATAWEDFKESFLYEDLIGQLQLWKEDVIAQYPEAESMLEKGRVDGRLEALVYFMSLPDVIIEAIKEAREQERNGEEESMCENFTDE